MYKVTSKGSDDRGTLWTDGTYDYYVRVMYGRSATVRIFVSRAGSTKIIGEDVVRRTRLPHRVIPTNYALLSMAKGQWCPGGEKTLYRLGDAFCE